MHFQILEFLFVACWDWGIWRVGEQALAGSWLSVNFRTRMNSTIGISVACKMKNKWLTAELTECQWPSSRNPNCTTEGGMLETCRCSETSELDRGGDQLIIQVGSTGIDWPHFAGRSRSLLRLPKQHKPKAECCQCLAETVHHRVVGTSQRLTGRGNNLPTAKALGSWLGETIRTRGSNNRAYDLLQMLKKILLATEG